MFFRGSVAGAKIVSVIRVNAVRDRSNSAFTCKTVKRVKKLVLAEVTAIGIIRRITWVGQLIRFDEKVFGWSAPQKKLHLFPVVRGVAGGDGGNNQRFRPKRLPRRPSKIRRVRSA